jgi:hypothetical protein
MYKLGSVHRLSLKIENAHWAEKTTTMRCGIKETSTTRYGIRETVTTQIFMLWLFFFYPRRGLG